MTERILEICKRESGVSGLSESSRLDDMNLDSLEFVQLMVCINSEVKDIPDAEWARMNTIGDIVRAAIG